MNDILGICCGYKVFDRVSIKRLRNECKMLSIEQRMHKQMLWLMFLLSKKGKYLKTEQRNTRSFNMVKFEVPNKITHVYEHSPYHTGTKP